MKQFATITVIGRDKTGVIARVTAFLFKQHANIEALEDFAPDWTPSSAGFFRRYAFQNGNMSGHVVSIAKNREGVDATKAAPVPHMQSFASGEAKDCIVF
jgi:formyltetrahydrofolate hydrolase